MTDLRRRSALELAALIREGEVTSREVVEAFITQCEWVNPTINALVRERFALARREADAADQLRAARGPEALPPLHGVPCSIKECFAVNGMPNSSGLVARKHVISTDDATAVTRLRRAGAIVLGVTNVSELCMWMESANFVYGRTNNPYDPARMVGGSSGGEAAIVAAAGAPFGLGSDVGGSIRGPAFFNGIFGHKPTAGLVPNSGQYPMSENDAGRYLTTGPFARHATDLWPLLRVLAGPDGKDPHCVDWELGDPAGVELAGRTVLNVEDDGVHIPVESLRNAQRQVVHHLESIGMKVRSVRFEALRKGFEIWSAMMGLAADTPFSVLMGNGKPINPVWEIAKLAAGRSPHTLMGSVLALTDRVPQLFPKRARELAKLGQQLKEELVGTLGEDGVMLYPSYSEPALKHGAPVRQALRLHMPYAYLGIMNVLELPSTQVPLGLEQRGLPVGLQVISRHGNDHVTIAVAMELERRFGGWVPPALAGLPAVS